MNLVWRPWTTIFPVAFIRISTDTTARFFPIRKTRASISTSSCMQEEKRKRKFILIKLDLCMIMSYVPQWWWLWSVLIKYKFLRRWVQWLRKSIYIAKSPIETQSLLGYLDKTNVGKKYLYIVLHFPLYLDCLIYVKTIKKMQKNEI